MNYPPVSCPSVSCDFEGNVVRRCVRPFGHGYSADGYPLDFDPETGKSVVMHYSAKTGPYRETSWGLDEDGEVIKTPRQIVVRGTGLR